MNDNQAKLTYCFPISDEILEKFTDEELSKYISYLFAKEYIKRLEREIINEEQNATN